MGLELLAGHSRTADDHRHLVLEDESDLLGDALEEATAYAGGVVGLLAAAPHAELRYVSDAMGRDLEDENLVRLDDHESALGASSCREGFLEQGSVGWRQAANAGKFQFGAGADDVGVMASDVDLGLGDDPVDAEVVGERLECRLLDLEHYPHRLALGALRPAVGLGAGG